MLWPKGIMLNFNFTTAQIYCSNVIYNNYTERDFPKQRMRETCIDSLLNDANVQMKYHNLEEQSQDFDPSKCEFGGFAKTISSAKENK